MPPPADEPLVDADVDGVPASNYENNSMENFCFVSSNGLWAFACGFLSALLLVAWRRGRKGRND